MKEEPKILRRGTQDWYLSLAINEVAERYRFDHNLPEEASVEISMDEINAILDKWRRSFFKRLWLLITNSDIKELNLGPEVRLKQ